MSSRYLLIGNPTAQSGKNAERISKAEAYLRAHGADVHLLPTQPEGKTIAALTHRLSREDRYAAVIAMGGDGTFREVAAGLMGHAADRRPPLAMLPTGTANDQGKSFGLSAEPDALEANVAVLVNGHETTLDAGLVRALDTAGNETRRDYFFDSLSWGLTARVLHVRNKDREAIAAWGPLADLYRDHAVYAGAFVKTFLESYIEDDKFAAHVRMDGQRFVLEGLTDLVLKATRVFAGSWVLDPRSTHNDGLFELCPFIGKRDWASKAIVALDAHPIEEDDLAAVGIEHSKNAQGRVFDVTLAPLGEVPVYAQIDGEEYVQSSRFTIEVIPRALRLIVPRAAIETS